MTSNILCNWFGIKVFIPRKSNMIKSRARTGYAAAYPQIKHYHRRKINFCSCIPSFYTSNKNNNESKLYQKHSSIKGCASFARYGKYQEGDTDEDC